MTTREVIEKRQPVGFNERPKFKLTTTKWGSSPTSVAVTCFKYEDGTYTDNTSSTFPTNTTTVNGDVITLSPLVPVAIGDEYYIAVKFTAGGSIFEAYFWVDVER